MMVVVMVVEALVDSRLTFALFNLSSLASQQLVSYTAGFLTLRI